MQLLIALSRRLFRRSDASQVAAQDFVGRPKGWLVPSSVLAQLISRTEADGDVDLEGGLSPEKFTSVTALTADRRRGTVRGDTSVAVTLQEILAIWCGCAANWIPVRFYVTVSLDTALLHRLMAFPDYLVVTYLETLGRTAQAFVGIVGRRSSEEGKSRRSSQPRGGSTEVAPPEQWRAYRGRESIQYSIADAARQCEKHGSEGNGASFPVDFSNHRFSEFGFVDAGAARAIRACWG